MVCDLYRYNKIATQDGHKKTYSYPDFFYLVIISMGRMAEGAKIAIF